MDRQWQKREGDSCAKYPGLQAINSRRKPRPAQIARAASGETRQNVKPLGLRYSAPARASMPEAPAPQWIVIAAP